jgi:hypothetical protein
LILFHVKSWIFSTLVDGLFAVCKLFLALLVVLGLVEALILDVHLVINFGLLLKCWHGLCSLSISDKLRIRNWSVSTS